MSVNPADQYKKENQCPEEAAKRDLHAQANAGLQEAAGRPVPCKPMKEMHIFEAAGGFVVRFGRLQYLALSPENVHVATDMGQLKALIEQAFPPAVQKPEGV